MQLTDLLHNHSCGKNGVISQVYNNKKNIKWDMNEWSSVVLFCIQFVSVRWPGQLELFMKGQESEEAPTEEAILDGEDCSMNGKIPG